MSGTGALHISLDLLPLPNCDPQSITDYQVGRGCSGSDILFERNSALPPTLLKSEREAIIPISPVSQVPLTFAPTVESGLIAGSGVVFFSPT